MALTKVSYAMINGAAVNILDYGALASASDNTLAIQAALDTGLDVYVPEGTFYSAALTIDTNGQRIFGIGTLKAISTLSDGILISISANVTDVVIENIVVDGNSSNRSGGTTTNSYEVVLNTNCDRTVIQNLTVKNAYGNAIGVYVSDNVTVQNCEINGYGVNGIMFLQNCAGALIDGNNVIGTGTQNGIFINGQNTNGATDVVINGNYVYGSGDFGIEVGNVFSGNHTNVSVTGNTVRDCVNAGISFRRVENGTITGNSVKDVGAAVYGADGIFCTGDSGFMYGLTISGNTILTRSTAQVGIHVTNYAQIAISGNNVEGGTTSCIYLEGDSGRSLIDFTVTGNQLTCAANGANGIYAYSDSVGISNGVIANNQMNAGTPSATNGILISSNTSDLTIEGNQIHASLYNGITVYQATNIILANNLLTDCANGNGTSDQRCAMLVASSTKVTASGNMCTDSGSTNPMTYAVYVKNSTNVQVSNQQGSGYATALYGGTTNTTSYIHLFAAAVTSAAL